MIQPHSSFVQFMGATLKPNVYLEIGTGDGDTFKMIAPFVPRAIAVDCEIHDDLVDFEHYQMNANCFFDSFNEEVDLVFIDAGNDYTTATNDVMNALKLLSDDGMIILNGTNPISGDTAGEEGPWTLIDDIEGVLDALQNINVVTFPVGSPGLSVITKKQCSRSHIREA